MQRCFFIFPLLFAVSIFAETPATTTAPAPAPSKLDLVLRLVDDSAVIAKQAQAGILAAVEKTLELRLRGKKEYPPAALGSLPESLRAEAYDLALLAEAVYQKQTPMIGKATSYIAIDELCDDACGFKARVFENAEKKKIVIAFEGTTGGIAGPKWLTNYQNFLGSRPDQYAKAVAYVQSWQSKPDKKDYEIQLTGHSLGGGLATYAALSSGLKATTFNAAGIGNGLLELLESRETTKVRLKSAKEYITNIDTRFDPISAMGGQLGQTYIIETPAPKFTTIPATAEEAVEYVYNNLLASHFVATVVKTLKPEPVKNP